MERVGNVWRVRPGKAEEYRRRHATVWPEIDALLREVGVERYTIYLWGDLVFSHLEVPSYAELVRRFNGDPWRSAGRTEMGDLLEYPNADPETGWPERLVEVWSL